MCIHPDTQMKSAEAFGLRACRSRQTSWHTCMQTTENMDHNLLMASGDARGETCLLMEQQAGVRPKRRMSARISARISAPMSARRSARMSTWMSTRISARISARISTRISTRISGNAGFYGVWCGVWGDTDFGGLEVAFGWSN